MFDFSKNLRKLPPYLFAAIDDKKADLRKKGVKFLDLSVGDPDIQAPANVVKVLSKSAKLKSNQKYASNRGKLQLRKSIKKWMKKRFKVNLVDSQILPVLGTKEALAHLPVGLINKGDYIITPSPGYPGYRAAGVLSGARVYQLPLLEKSNFLPDLEKIPKSVKKRAKIIYLNYPNNPTTVFAPKSFMEKVVKFCLKNKILLVWDNAYSEIYFDKKPLSILQIKDAKKIALEFHSLSKTFCMTGFRVGWVCGNPDAVNILAKVKSNVDSGIFGVVQDAAITALDKDSAYVTNLRKIFSRRRKYLLEALRKVGFKKFYADSTFYVWAKLPASFKSSLEFSRYLIEEEKIVATPGAGFGKYGEGFIRFALTVDKSKLRDIFKKKIPGLDI
ncbi:MAG: aminotransferase class I/II-fold pyridoxal phosphate-dependent enzyme [Candidatus Omnitrophica bacterium]|nr:aminotransferase class I/II-fold pyridoxal phosphate-dependent enzyme [Candidatus Omnitrophota bacterium]MCF7894792.1 aminotransferase class I/II-fold pyridoxal phosphate-dependent enzyme [Candidatus Omnitrophota bacterium]